MNPSAGAPLHARWQPGTTRTAIEHLTEFLLTGIAAPGAPPETTRFAGDVLRNDPGGTRVVLLGGGTGLSTIAGGNSRLPDWPAEADTGLKCVFDNLDYVVCTTDDGGSTGKLLQQLPMIGIGDLRKLLLSSMRPGALARRYRIGGGRVHAAIRIVHSLFNHRFPERHGSFACYRDPLRLVPPALRRACPEELAGVLGELGAYVSPSGDGPTIPPGGHALGNVFLAAAIFMAAGGRTDRPPALGAIQAGIDRIAGTIGAPAGRIHAATATPGQIMFRYANGVEVYGQSKASLAYRSSPVERIAVEFTREPVVSAAILKALGEADLILYAPGSLYTSIIPILQLGKIVEAIRANTRALKILGANAWVQEGETDRSPRDRHRGFLASELIEAYERNIPGGIGGLFDVVLSANMEHIPGSVLRNYALEGKSPIHLDRQPVEAMRLCPVEATLFSPPGGNVTQLIQHDPLRFSLAVRALLYIDRFLGGLPEYRLRAVSGPDRPGDAGRARQRPRRSPLLCAYLESIESVLGRKDIRPPALRRELVELAWKNRDLGPAHFMHFRGIRVIPAAGWNRSTELDNVLGYFDPKDRYIKLREDLLADPAGLQDNILIALGESLLGRYIRRRRWIEHDGARRYEITLETPARRACLLTDAQLRAYLALARMTPDPADPGIFRITLNREDGFLPPGLLFGLVYAWYLTGRSFTMEYEMTLLRWPEKSLIPMHAKERIRKEALVAFFREEIFGHGSD